MAAPAIKCTLSGLDNSAHINHIEVLHRTCLLMHLLLTSVTGRYEAFAVMNIEKLCLVIVCGGSFFCV